MIDGAERWRLIEELCHRALDRPPSERDAFLRGACRDDELRRDVEALLAHESAAERFLETTVGAAAASVLAPDGQPLLGHRLGAFEVGPLLGAGGMGEVYRAHDAHLRRDVALKILPFAFALDPGRLDRFKREAQVLASLNHPNIAAIHGFEQSDRAQALVLELVEGPTLADRIARGPIPVDEAVAMARQIAEGLEAAHELGVVHRDLKPANIKVRPDGTVKLLDFGLAKVLQPAASDHTDVGASPAITRPEATQAGTILGTASYLSPEQARGRDADKRSDIWAFGAVLFEMLSGRPVFKGSETVDIISAVIRDDIDWNVLPASTPAALRRLMARCLDRDVKHRLRDIGEARIVLEDPGTAAAVNSLDSGAPVAAPAMSLWLRTASVGLALIVGGIAGIAVWSFAQHSRSPGVARVSLTLPEGQSLSSGDRRIAAISPDGQLVVYVGVPLGLYLRPMSSAESRLIPGTEGQGNIGEPTFSPDSRSIVFHSGVDQTLKTIPIAGGTAATICSSRFAYGLSWVAGGVFFVEPGQGIMRVHPGDGRAQMVVRLNEGEAAQSPQLLPDGEHLLFSLAAGGAPDRWDKGAVVVESLKSGERTLLMNGGSDARYVPTGHLVYAIGGSLFARAFDLEGLHVHGGAVPVVQGVRRSADVIAGGAQFSFSSSGSLVYIPGAASAQWDLALTDRHGNSESLKLPPGRYEAPRVSPDGKRLAFSTDDGKEAIVWTFDLSGGEGMKRLTYTGRNRYPTWSPDSTHVAFQSDRDGDAAIFVQRLSDTRAHRLTIPRPGESHEPEAWSPDGKVLLFGVTRGADVSLWMRTSNGNTSPFRGVHSTTKIGAVFHPNGHWVAYASSDDKKKTVYVEPFPGPGRKEQLVHTGGGHPNHPLWAPDGHGLFYNPGPGQFESVDVTTEPSFIFGKAVAVPRPFAGAGLDSRRPYDITGAGKFVSPVAAGQSRRAAAQIEVVLNWFEDLKARFPAAKASGRDRD